MKKYFIVRTPSFFKGEGVNFDYLPQRGESEKSKKEGGSIVQGQVFLEGMGVALFLLIFSRFIIFAFRNYFTLWKIVLCIWRKKVILS